jgi:hypothetical protein
MRLRKFFLSMLLAMALAIETYCLGWSAEMNDRDTMVIYTLRVLFTAYTLGLAARSIHQIPHFESIVHISALTFFVTTLLFVTSIIPSANTHVAPVLANVSATFRGLGWMLLILHSMSFAVSSTIPQSPPLYYSADKIYQGKVAVEHIAASQGNVCGITSTSLQYNKISRHILTYFPSCFSLGYSPLLLHN